ncbi:tetratricopeptide repeat protein [Leisingera sp. S232]|uniref:tetratricopeptide repeat protein n=1 Tax=Leisingera sp. S232 TaxID=3415132 RepID=UPI000869751A|nr:hypothetical protein AB838_05765 [Rhodobacteraceae bacterium (ex Bugula neritina AB1)]
MNMAAPLFNADDMFVLGNIAATAIKKGHGALAEPLLKLIQEERPANAGAFVLEAMYLHSVGRTDDAREFLETSGAFQTENNRDEAVAFHLYLMQQAGQIEQAHELGQTYLAEGLVTSDSAVSAVSTVVSECADELFETIEDIDGSSVPEEVK